LKIRNDELQKVKSENRRLIEASEKLQGEFDNYKAISRGMMSTTRQSTVDQDRNLSKSIVTFLK